MEFFDTFIFNNVKSGLKIILYQPNKVVFKVKVVTFLMSIPIPEAPMQAFRNSVKDVIQDSKTIGCKPK